MMIRFLTALVLFLGLHTGVQASGKRLALVIGNANYTELPTLQKTHGDAGGYRDALRELGFEVSLHTDLDFFGTAQAVGDFIGRIQPGDEVAFVFAGHGWSDGRTNYLLPVNAPGRGSGTVLAQLSLPLKNGVSGILDQITGRGASLNFSVIDACRDNPFVQADGTRSAGLARGGLSGIAAPAGSFVVYSAGEGQTALDRLSNDDANPYSVFSRVFIPKLRSGISLEQAANETQQEVSSLAATIGHVQQPAYYDQALGNTVLKVATTDLSRIAVTPNTAQIPAPAASPTPTPQQSGDPAKEAYEAAKTFGTAGAFQAVIDSYPGTFWARLAAEEIAKIATVAPPPPAPSDPCKTYRGIPPTNARCVVQNGEAIWLSLGPTPAELERQRQQAIRQQADRQAAQTALAAAEQAQREAARAAAQSQRENATPQLYGALTSEQYPTGIDFTLNTGFAISAIRSGAISKSLERCDHFECELVAVIEPFQCIALARGNYGFFTLYGFQKAYATSPNRKEAIRLSIEQCENKLAEHNGKCRAVFSTCLSP